MASLDKRFLSTAEVAKALGVGVTTVKRWVDENLLPAHKTPGGHRKLLRADVIRFAKNGSFPDANLSLLGIVANGMKTTADCRREFMVALHARDGNAIREFIQHAHKSQMPVSTLADEIIAPAFAEIGHDWETDRIDVYHEHHSSQLVAAALYELKNQLGAATRGNRPLAIGGSPEGDPYLLSNLLIEVMLLEQGWRVQNFGPNTPLKSLRKALVEQKPRLLWISVNYLDDVDDFARQYRSLYAEAKDMDVSVALGGPVLTDDVRSRIIYTTFGDGLSHLSDFAASIAPQAKRPRRGRPVVG